MSERLAGKTALITGSTSNIGRAMAVAFGAQGAHVAVSGRSAERGAAVVAQIRGAGGRADFVAADLDGSPASSRRLAEEAGRVLGGRIDVLVNNAGITANLPAEDEPLDTFRSVLDLNVSALFRVTQLVGRHMLEQRSGSVVNVASAMGFVAAAPLKQASYTASKGAVVNLTRELAVQWARKGVRVNALGPGFFPSEITASMLDDERAMSWVRSNTPIPRFGEEHELDGALLFLASDASSFCTGQTIVVDGGWTAR
jgi:NAD(P)-dependent dehydrogenase (short-subunit alcohol dehydrogenase family)